jgi:leucyl/phenylalanyl-tRNA--protein transferase
VQLLRKEQVVVIDCQQNTEHLASLGARGIARVDFCSRVAAATRQTAIDWSIHRATTLNFLLGSY